MIQNQIKEQSLKVKMCGMRRRLSLQEDILAEIEERMANMAMKAKRLHSGSSRKTGYR